MHQVPREGIKLTTWQGGIAVTTNLRSTERCPSDISALAFFLDLGVQAEFLIELLGREKAVAVDHGDGLR